MGKRKLLFNKVYIIAALMMLFMTALAGIQAMASTNSEERKVHWESSTKDEEIQAPDGLTSDGGKWESPTFTSSDNEINDKDIATKPMTAANEYAAIAAALAGVLAISASKKSTNEGLPTVSEGNGIWVPETDRDEVIKMINKAASKEYYIDANGFVKEVPGTVENLSKSSTYSSVLDRLIAGDNKVVIGVGDGWVSAGETGLEANAFTGNNSGITIGDNGTPQVVIVSGKDMPESTADMTLAHELTHALRGEEGIKSINMTDGINKDEEAHTIELENKIRTELGYAVRKDGDTSDGGDGSYGKYSDSLEDDWYNRIDQMQKSVTLSGNPYSYSLFGAIVSAVVSIVRAITSSSSSSSSSSSRSSSSSSSSSRSSSSSSSRWNSSSSSYNSSTVPVPPPIPIWGSGYDDSVWGKVGGAVSNVVNSVLGWVSESKPKQNWDTFWNSIPNTVTDNINVLSKIGAAISTYLPGIFSIPATLGQVFNSIVLKPTGWVKDNNGNWYYYNSNSVMQTGWIQDKGKWYYLDSLGKMKTGWLQDTDGKLYYLNPEGKDGNPKGAMQTGWVKDTDDKWYYLDAKGKMLANEWKNDEGKWYYFDASGQMVINDWIKDDGKYYYINSDGEMEKNIWIKDDEKWYYLNDSGAMQTGWLKKDSKWYYLDDSGVMKTGWIQDKGKLYYLNEENGDLKTGWVKDDDSKWHYYDKYSGVSKDGWINDDGTYYYLDSTGDVKKGWFKYGESWYYLDGSGAMQAGWLKDNAEWYYLNSSGEMQTGWIKDEDNGDWYHLDSNGKMETYWIKDKDKDYYLYSNGVMATGWMKTSDEDWYYFNKDSGEMLKSEWLEDEDGNSYGIDSSGKMYAQIIYDEYGGRHVLDSKGEELDDGRVEDDDSLENVIDILAGVGGIVRAGGKIIFRKIGKGIIAEEKVIVSKAMENAFEGAGKVIIKSFDRKTLFENSAKHIFSDKHIKSGIMDLGNSEEEIMKSAIDIVEEIDGKGMLKEGPTQIKTIINGYEAEIRIFIKDGKPLNFDMFKGHSPRDMGNSIYYNP